MAQETAVKASDELLSRKALSKDVLKVCERSSHEITSQAGFPPAIELGPRILRWSRNEVLDWLATRAPRRTARVEPVQLAQARGATRPT